MLKIRKANTKDNKIILQILEEVDESTSSMDFNDFYVAEEENKIIGAAKLEEFKSFLFLSSLAVKIKYQKQGIAKKILENIFKKAKKDIYLYTVIPDFFSKFGFKKIATPSFLPTKSALECERCSPEQCTTMVRKQNDT